jgi:hypothetical protein
MNKDSKMLAEAYENINKLKQQKKEINNIINWLDKNTTYKTDHENSDDIMWIFKGLTNDGLTIVYNKTENTFWGFYSSDYTDDTIDMDDTTSLTDIQNFVETNI